MGANVGFDVQHAGANGMCDAARRRMTNGKSKPHAVTRPFRPVIMNTIEARHLAQHVVVDVGCGVNIGKRTAQDWTICWKLRMRRDLRVNFVI